MNAGHLPLLSDLERAVWAALSGLVPAPENLPKQGLRLELTKDPLHGDLASNAAMVAARGQGMAPRALARQMADALGADSRILSAAVAGPGFVNLRLRPEVWAQEIAVCLQRSEQYGQGHDAAHVVIDCLQTPTDDHPDLRQVRGAILGDALARVLRFSGNTVSLEVTLNQRLEGRIDSNETMGAAHNHLPVQGARAVYVPRFATLLETHAANAKARKSAGVSHLVAFWPSDQGGDVASLPEMAGLPATVHLLQMVTTDENLSAHDILEAGDGDALRIFLLCHPHDKPVHLGAQDLRRASHNNPAFLMQHALMRLRRMLSETSDACAHFEAANQDIPAPLRALARRVCDWPRAVGVAAQLYDPTRVGSYLMLLCQEFHTLADQSSQLDAMTSKDATIAKNALLRAVEVVICNGFAILGVSSQGYTAD